MAEKSRKARVDEYAKGEKPAKLAELLVDAEDKLKSFKEGGRPQLNDAKHWYAEATIEGSSEKPGRGWRGREPDGGSRAVRELVDYLARRGITEGYTITVGKGEVRPVSDE